MPPAKTLCARAGRLSIASVVLVCALIPASASAAAGRPSAGALSPRLAELAKPSVRSLPPVRQARLLSLARSGPGSLLRQGSRVLVDVRFEHGAVAGVEALRRAGAKVVNVSRRYQTVTVAARPVALRAIAGAARVASVDEVLTPLLYAAGSTCPQGVALSEGDEQLRAAEARETFGVDGSGVTVGILSDSFDKAIQAADGSGPVATDAEQDVESGDLPGAENTCPGQETPVDVLEEFSPTEPGEEAADEGRAMAQIVHDLAPGANLAFASAFNGEISFAEGIERLARPVTEAGAGAGVIADDVAYFDEPFFQDGPVADAINEVTAKGADYFTAAGNDNLIEAGTGNEIASWEAPEFRGSGSCSAALQAEVGAANAADCMDFKPAPEEADSGFGITVKAGATLTVDLQWAEAWFGVKTDLDAFLLDSEGNPIRVGGKLAASAEDNVGAEGSHEPFEFLQWENTGPEQEVQLAINRCSGTCNQKASPTATPPLKFILMESGWEVAKTEYPTSAGGDTVGPTIFGHAGSAGAISTGAVRYNTTSAPERYSSRGPVTHYLGPVNGTTPAAPLPVPQILSKPDLAATDCGVTTFFASQDAFSNWRFCGTSAAAPHAAAVAALMRQRDPAAAPDQIRTWLMSTARPVGVYGHDAIGSGLVDALGAVESASPVKVSGGEEVTEELQEPLPEPLPEPTSPTSSGPASVEPPPRGTSSIRSSPRAFLRRHPRRLVLTRHRRAKLVFRFGASERRVSFFCRLGRRRVHRCRRQVVWRLAPGRHGLRVVARDAAGNVSRRPAVFRFRVKRIG
jgi:hypothetical protein